MKFFEALIDHFTAWIKSQYERFTGYIQAKIQKAIIYILELLGKESISWLQAYISKFDKDVNLPDELKPLWNAIKEGKGEAAGLLAMQIASGAAATMQQGFLQVLLRRPTQELNKIQPTNIPDLQSAIIAAQRGFIDEKRMREYALLNGWHADNLDVMKKLAIQYFPLDALRDAYYKGRISKADVITELQHQGYDEHSIPAILDSWIQLYSAGDLLTMLNRHIINEAEARTWIKWAGFTDTQTENILRLRYNVPSITDMLEMFTKNVTDEELAQRFELDVDKPPHFYEWFELNGISKEWADMYWREYWRYPSPEQLYAMLHRGLITPQDVEKVLLILNYPKFWRNKLMALSFNPYTRIDVRRLYRDGVITKEEVKKTYLQLGYDEEHAEKLTEWTVINSSGKEKEITKSNIINAYKEGSISADEAKSLLLDIGYSKEASEFLISQVDFENEHKAVTSIRNTLHKLFVTGKKGEEFTRAKLAETGWNTYQIDKAMEIWKLEREENTTKSDIAENRELTKSEILKGYKASILTKEETESYLKALGYDSEQIEFYIALADFEIEKHKKQLSLSQIKKMYLEGIISDTEVLDRLGALGLNAAEMKLLMEEWQIESEPKLKHPSKADLNALIKYKIISIEDYKNELRNQGYSEKYINWYAQLLEKKGGLPEQ